MSEESRNAPLSSERRLAAIVFTDVAGYSARMQQDETGTLVLVKADFARMRELCARHGGEVLKSTGDGLLLCFASVVQAVACALEIQRGFIARGPDALQHRIGIHLGDVFREDGDVAGDGVNIAARLQTKARPGTICLSQSVHDAVKGKLPMQAESLGAQQFKNITRPITVYLLTLTGSPSPAPMVQKSRAAWLVAAGLAVVAALAVVFWPKPAPVAPAAAQTPAQIVSDKSIAVLPFANMSDDKENVFFTDGVHEDVLTNLANIGALKVISRTSMLQYRSTTKSIKQIGAELGVAYILEGSVRRAGKKVRVTGQLIRTTTDEHLWAKTYDRDLTDVFAIQAELSREIVAALQAVLTPQDNLRLDNRPTKNMAAYDLFLKARAVSRTGSNTQDLMERALPLFAEAVRLDPDYAAAWTEICLIYVDGAAFNQVKSWQARARDALTQAERLAPDDFAVLLAGLRFGGVSGNRALAKQRLQRIKELFPNRAESYHMAGHEAEEELRWLDALADYRQAYALDPRNAEVNWHMRDILRALRRYDDAEVVLKEQQRLQPDHWEIARSLAAIPFYDRGSKVELTAFLARVPADRDFADTNLTIAKAQALAALGDAPGLIRMWRAAGPQWKFSSGGKYRDRLWVAAAFLSLNEKDSARPLLEQNRDELRVLLTTEQDNAYEWSNLGLSLGMLGDQAAARAALAKSGELVRAETLATKAARDRFFNTLVRAWAGEKAESVTELARMLHDPLSTQWANVHYLRHSWLTLPLHGDPAFEALLNDPASNAPLP